MNSLNSHITSQMLQDLSEYKFLTSFYKYKFKDKKEQKIIKEIFNVEHDGYNDICYSIDSKIIRKLKLLKINKDKKSILIDKILKSSKLASAEDVIGYKLSDELARKIDKNILNNLLGKLKM